MPTYEYQCDACGHTLEEMQSFSEAPLKKCPACKKNKLRRLLGSGAAVIFKGSGFYQTDYRSDSYKNAAKADTKTESASSDAGKKADTTATPAKADTTAPAETPAPAKTKSSGKKPKSGA